MFLIKYKKTIYRIILSIIISTIIDITITKLFKKPIFIYNSKIARTLNYEGVVLFPFILFDESLDTYNKSIDNFNKLFKHEMTIFFEIKKSSYKSYYSKTCLEFSINILSNYLKNKKTDFSKVYENISFQITAKNSKSLKLTTWEKELFSNQFLNTKRRNYGSVFFIACYWIWFIVWL